jgi:hypothetical protein
MDSRCSSGPHAGFCVDATTAAQCTDGVYAETLCTGEEVCGVDGLVASCAEPVQEDSGEGDGTAGGGDGTDGGAGSAGEGGSPEDAGDDLADAFGRTDPPSASSGRESGGCAVAGAGMGSLPGVLGGLSLLWVVRRRED